MIVRRKALGLLAVLPVLLWSCHADDPTAQGGVTEPGVLASGYWIPDGIAVIGEGDFLFVLVPGDRTISWPKLRELLGVSRMSMPDAATALEATGYERGTITPFGSTTAWPVIADERLLSHEVTLGGGAHGVALAVDAGAAVTALDATVADVTDSEA